MGSVGSVQFQIVPCFSLYLFSRSISPLQCLVNVNYRVLIWCTCSFQSSSLFFVYFSSSFCKSLQCLISTLTQGGKGGYLFQLTCSVVLWGGSDAANKYRWRVWGVFAVYGPHWICSSSRQRVLPVSTLLGLQGALQGHCPKRAMCFLYSPGLNHSRSLVLRKGTDSVGCAFCVLPRSEQLRRAGVWWAHCPRWAVHLNHFPGLAAPFPRCTMRAPSQVCCVSPLGSWSQAATVWVDVNHPGSQEDMVSNWEPFTTKFSLFSLSLVVPQFGLQSHVSSLGLSSAHAGPVLTLSTDYGAVCPWPAPTRWWWTQASVGYFSTGSCG